jgi:hypothetical protein
MPVKTISGSRTNSTDAVGGLLQEVVLAPRVIELEPQVLADVGQIARRLQSFQRVAMSRRKWPLTARQHEQQQR